MSSVTIRSQVKYDDNPIWTIEFENDTSLDDRALAIRVANGENSESMLLWRVRGEIIKQATINLLGLDVPDLGQLNQASDTPDVVLAKLKNEFFLQKGAIPIRGYGDSMGPLPTPISMMLSKLLGQMMDRERVKLKLHAEGLIFDLYQKKFDKTEAENKKITVLLTVNEVGDLILCPVPVQNNDSENPKWRLLQDAINKGLVQMRSTAQWCDWLWQRAADFTDLRIPVELKKEINSKYHVITIIKNVIDLSPSLLRVVLRDQRPGSELPPLSRMEFDPQCVRLCVEWNTNPVIKSLTLSRGKKERELKEGVLAYNFVINNVETLAGEYLALGVNPTLPERIQALRADGKVKRGFVPVRQGWLQLPLTKSTDEKTLGVDLEGRIVRDDSDLGVFEIGTRRVERESEPSVQDTMPWSMRLQGFNAFCLTFTIDNMEDNTGKISKISGNFFQPMIRLRGLLWMAIGRPEDDDLLPQLELGNGFMRDIEFETLEKDNVYWTVELTGLMLKAGTGWPEIAFSTIAFSKLTAPLVLWGRHPTLPGIQVQPLTSAREAPARALGSRELLPLKLVHETLGDMTSLELNYQNNNWPELRGGKNGAYLEFWWPRIIPAESDKSWIEGPEIKRGFPLVALSMPGVEFWFKSDLMEYKCKTALRMDLPYSDEMYANARHSKQEEIKNQPIPDLAFDADDAIQELWLRRHDAWMLSLGKGTLLVGRENAGFIIKNEALLPGFPWGGTISIDTEIFGSKNSPCFGAVNFEERATGFKQKLSGSELLEGLSAGIQLDDKNKKLSLIKKDSADDNPPKMLGFALPLMTFNSKRLDADGTLSEPFNAEKGEQSVQVHVAEKKEGVEFTRLTLNEPVAFKLMEKDGTYGAYAFWCRELPCTKSGSNDHLEFDRDKLCNGDILPPPLAGFEWRIYRQGKTACSDFPFNKHFQLQAFSLKCAERNANTWTLTLRAWLKPAVLPDLRLGEVEVILELKGDNSKISSVKKVNDDSLIWPLNNLVVGGKNQTHAWQREPWIELKFSGDTSLDCADLHVPLFGYWQTITLRPSDGSDILKFVYNTSTNKIPGLTQLEVTIEKEPELSSLSFKLDTDAIEAVIELNGSAQKSIPKITFTRFPGYNFPEPLSIDLEHFDILLNSGFALCFALSSNNDKTYKFLFSPGFEVIESNQQWSLGIGMGMASDKLKIQTLYLEGTVLGKQGNAEARIDILATIRPNKFDKSQSSFRIRLVGRWMVNSIIDWPKAEIQDPKIISPGYKVNFDSTINRKSKMQMHWRGEVLEGETLAVQKDGSISLNTSQSPLLLCTHIFTQNEIVYSFEALHPVFIGTLYSLKKRLDNLGNFRVANLSNTDKAKDALNGFIGSKFAQFLDKFIKSKNANNVRVVVSTPLLLFEKYLGIFAVMAILDDGKEKNSIADFISKHFNKFGNAVMALLGEGKAKDSIAGAEDDSIAEYLNKFKEDIEIYNMDAKPQPLEDSVTHHEVLIRESDPSISGDDIVPRWARLDSLPVPTVELDSTWICVHQQQLSSRDKDTTDYPLLRTKIWISEVLSKSKKSKPQVYTAAMSAQGQYFFFDASKLTYVPRHMSPFANSSPMTDLIVAGEYGLANMLTARKPDTEPDANWLSEAITARLGRPSFAIQRMRGDKYSKIIDLPKPRIELTEGTVLRRLSFPDAELGSSRSPLIDGNKKLIAAEIRTELLHRTPLINASIPSVANGGDECNLTGASGTRHLYRVPRMAGTEKQIWQCLQEQVLFAAPRPKAQVASAIRTTWPALLDPMQLSCALDLKQQKQALSHPYRETISFAQRSGISRTHREAIILLESKDKVVCHREQGLSFAHGFRAPRPLGLPECRQCRAMLSEKKLDVFEGVADVAVVPKLPFPDSEDISTKETGWLPTRFSLVGPQYGIVKPSWNGVFKIEYCQYGVEDNAYLNRSGVSEGFSWYAILVVQGKTYKLEVEVVKGQPLLHLKPSEDFVRPKSGSEFYGKLLLIIAPNKEPFWPIKEPSVTLEFPLVFVPAQRFSLPMRAFTITFFDPVFNAALGSEVAQAKDEIKTLYLDRQTYNATGTMVLMVKKKEGPEDKISIKFERWRRDSRSGVLQVDSLFAENTSVKDKTELVLSFDEPVRLELGAFRVVDSKDTTDIFLPGDMLRVFEPVANGPSVLLAISSEPVLPAPEAAYALWRVLSESKTVGESKTIGEPETVKQVQCPRYGLGIMPERVDFVDAKSDLEAGRMRRSALFRWLIVSPTWEANVGYFLQRIDHVGSTHFPKTNEDFVKPIPSTGKIFDESH